MNFDHVADIALWDEDPVEYVHKKFDDFEDFYSPSTAAVDFLLTLTKERRKLTFLPVLQFVNSVLTTRPVSSVGGPSVQSCIERDGALAMLGTLSPAILAKESPVRGQIANVLAEHVIPELRSPYPFLKARACQVLISFCREDDDDAIFGPDATAWSNIAEQTLQLMSKTEDLPVRVNAALFLERLLSKDTRDNLAPHVAFIMQGMLYVGLPQQIY